MLTNKIISVLIILISLSFTSCWTTNDKISDENKQIEKVEIVEMENSIDWKKGKSIWWEAINKKGNSESISDSGLKFNK